MESMQGTGLLKIQALQYSCNKKYLQEQFETVDKVV